MADIKTQPHDGDVAAFLDAIPDATRRSDARTVCALMERVAGEPPVMWGPSIVGFGSRHLVYDSGREMDWMLVGFAPRKASTTLYITEGFDSYPELLARLGPHSTGKSCLYVKRVEQVDLDVLEELVRQSVEHQRAG